jgi:uncharacterized membrane protein
MGGIRRKPVSGRARAVVIFLDRAIIWLGRHWLSLFNTLAGIYVGLPLLAPVFAASGAAEPARAIYFTYSYLCHQQPARSFFIFGHQMAFCQRDAAIYGAVFLAGLCYALSGRAWRPLSWWGAALLVLPTVIDGSLQLFMPYESNWALRLVTGVLAGVAAVWFLYPRFQLTFVQFARLAAMQLARAGVDSGYDSSI